jgi:hypothetical protein
MKVTKVCCQGCGADLQIDESIRYVTCNYCHCRLEVVHDATVTHTRQLDKIERTTEQLAKKLKVIELQNDVEQLDRGWEKFRDAVLVRDKNGQICEPSGGESILVGILGIGCGIVWIIVCATNQSPVVALVGLAIIGISILAMRNGSEKAETYRIQRYRYETARKSLLGRLEGERGD